MRIIAALVIVAFVLAVVKDIAFGTGGNGMSLLVWGALIAAVVRGILLAHRADLARAERGDE